MAFSNPPSFPSFPTDLPVAALQKLQFSQLISKDDAESKKLFQICSSTGVFLLDLTESPEGKALLAHVNGTFELGEKIFNLDMKEKQQYSMLNGTVLGYKAAGVGRIDAQGTPDRCEFWCMSKDDVLGLIPQLPAPPIVKENRDLYAHLSRSCHELSMYILDCLETQLGLPAGTLRQCHRIQHRSSDQTRQIRYLPQPDGDMRTSLVPHTDYGSVTVLFNILGGLQILPEEKEAIQGNWQWVKPVAGCAIVNLGDAMAKFTNGLLRSPMHRVTYAPGDQSKLTRYSLAYFVRPEDTCVMKRLEGSDLIPNLEHGEEEQDVTAVEWIKIRVKAALVQKGEEKQKFPKWAIKGLD